MRLKFSSNFNLNKKENINKKNQKFIKMKFETYDWP